MTVASTPESFSEARDHQRIVRYAERAGLCLLCAVHLANGTQLGFTVTAPPCPSCVPIVSAWPIEKLNGWRTLPGRVARQPTWKGHYNLADVDLSRPGSEHL
ncbi:hypothetical protein [Krasilnikoviella flava]|uniref:hypothetical protein n=1 Tax=Krasilnikoviella flava TaxID=526729 RepID=UPI00158FA6A5|nr:hypothetical protein [Krasilnikoviella flava]